MIVFTCSLSFTYICLLLRHRTAKLKRGLQRLHGSTPPTPTPCPIPALPCSRWTSLLPLSGATACRCCSLPCGPLPATAPPQLASPLASHSRSSSSSSNTNPWRRTLSLSPSNLSTGPRTFPSTDGQSDMLTGKCHWGSGALLAEPHSAELYTLQSTPTELEKKIQCLRGKTKYKHWLKHFSIYIFPRQASMFEKEMYFELPCFNYERCMGHARSTLV